MKAIGTVFKYGDNIDTDVIIPARCLNITDRRELASHCMEDIDRTFVKRVHPGDLIVGGFNFGCGSSREHAPMVIKENGVSCVIAKTFARIFTAMPSISACRSLSAPKPVIRFRTETRLRSILIRVSFIM